MLSFQGMNFIAGYLVLITKSEEESFWLLDALVGRILPGRLRPPGAVRAPGALLCGLSVPAVAGPRAAPSCGRWWGWDPCEVPRLL